MKARFHGGWAMTAVYAAGGIFLLWSGERQERTPLLLMGLCFLVLAVIQGWLSRRDRGRYQNVLLGPVYAIFGVFWLYDGFSGGYGHSVGFGLLFLIVAAVWVVREARDGGGNPCRGKEKE